MAVVQRQHNKNAGVILFLYTERERAIYTYIFFGAVPLSRSAIIELKRNNSNDNNNNNGNNEIRLRE